jgi:predicted AlkP superfamily pyrophosphatase or phosphodiesterase
MKKTIILLLVGLALVVLVQDFLQNKKKAQPVAPRPYVVMLSLDGFRWDYQDKAPTPTLDSITKYGVKATGLQPSFPSKTFPNHYSIVTGLYPGNHELISNSFYAPDIKQYYSIRDRSKVENGKFYKGEPIWVTAEAQRVKTGSYFWVGSEAKIKGYQPTYWKLYDHKFPYYQRVDSIINWLNKPYSERPKLITWYLDKADGVGHKHGPDSKELANTIPMLDSVIGYFLQQTNMLDIKDSINFIIVSDHGMQTIDTQKVVYLDSYIKPQWVDTLIGSNPFYLVQPNEDFKDSILTSLLGVEGINAWAKEDIPEKFHFKQSKRVPEILVVAKNGWSLTANSKHKVYAGGTHGYDNTIPDMNGIFYAIGPNFKNGYNAGQLYNTDIYNLIAHICNLISNV